MSAPSEQVFAHLCECYPRTPKLDILKLWQNASQYWANLHPICTLSEPPELTAARCLYVHGHLGPCDEERQHALISAWHLTAPYDMRHKRTKR